MFENIGFGVGCKQVYYTELVVQFAVEWVVDTNFTVEVDYFGVDFVAYFGSLAVHP